VENRLERSRLPFAGPLRRSRPNLSPHMCALRLRAFAAGAPIVVLIAVAVVWPGVEAVTSFDSGTGTLVGPYASCQYGTALG
jgi:hypothetical protein